MPVSPKVVTFLRSQGHDVIHCRDAELDKADDEEILARARNEKRILLTMDLDFPAIYALKTIRFPSLIIFRIQEPKPERIIKLLKVYWDDFQRPLKRGAVVVVEDFRIRVRDLPIKQ